VANGANITIAVTGAPSSSAQVDIVCLAAPDTAWNLYIRLLGDGNGSEEMVVDWEAPAGVYNVTVFQGGNLLAVTNFTVYRDMASYANHRCDLLEAQLAAVKAKDVRQDKNIATVTADNADQWKYIIGAVIGAAVAAGICWYCMKPHGDWKIRRMKELKGDRSFLVNLYYSIRFPDPEGQRTKAQATLLEEQARIKTKNPKAKMQLIVPTEAGRIVYPVTEVEVPLPVAVADPKMSARLDALEKELDEVIDRIVSQNDADAQRTMNIQSATIETKKPTQAPAPTLDEELAAIEARVAFIAAEKQRAEEERLQAEAEQAAAEEAARVAAETAEKERLASVEAAKREKLELLKAQLAAEEAAKPTPPAPSKAPIKRTTAAKGMSVEEMEKQTGKLEASPDLNELVKETIREKVMRLKKMHPEWDTAKIAREAKVTENTVQRHISKEAST
jgi:hypothetical protein